MQAILYQLKVRIANQGGKTTRTAIEKRLTIQRVRIYDELEAVDRLEKACEVCKTDANSLVSRLHDAYCLL
jgi:hypothetical protein